MKPSILRVKEGGRAYWCVADGSNTVSGSPGQSMAQVVKRYEDLHGRPPKGYVRITGQLRPSEAAMHRAELARRVPKSCRVCGCTDDDCRQCVEKTGHACTWVEPDLCSACVPSAGALKLSEVAGITASDTACLGAVGLRTLDDLSRACGGDLDRVLDVLAKWGGAFSCNDVHRIAGAVKRHLLVGVAGEGGAP